MPAVPARSQLTYPIGPSETHSNTSPREHSVQQYIGARLEVLGTGILHLVVADAILAGHEDHRRRRDAREIHCVVRRAAYDLPARKPKHLRRTVHGAHAFVVEVRSRELDHLPYVAFQAQIARNDRGSLAQLAIHRRQRLVIRMSDVDAHRDLAWDDVAGIRLDLHEAHGSPTIGRVFERDRVDGFHHPRSAAQGVMTRLHRRRAGVRILTGPAAVVPALPERAGHYADHLVFPLEDRPLLDVRFEVGVHSALADGCATGIADVMKRFTERDAIDIALGEKIVEREDSGEGAGSAHGRNESGAFLIGPYRNTNRLLRHDAGAVERAQHLQSGE